MMNNRFLDPSLYVRRALTVVTIVTILFAPGVMAVGNSSVTRCESVGDLDFHLCKPENLSIAELKSICASIGLQIETDMFPHIFFNEAGSASPKHIHTQADYAKAAYECIFVADETDTHLEEHILEDHPEIMAEIVSEVIETNPTLVDNLVNELQKEDPEVWKSISAELAAGQSILDKPEILSELIHSMLDQGLVEFGFEDDEYVDDYVYDIPGGEEL